MIPDRIPTLTVKIDHLIWKENSVILYQSSLFSVCVSLYHLLHSAYERFHHTIPTLHQLYIPLPWLLSVSYIVLVAKMSYLLAPHSLQTVDKLWCDNP
jgi:hypothetical protein